MVLTKYLFGFITCLIISGVSIAHNVDLWSKNHHYVREIWLFIGTLSLVLNFLILSGLIYVGYCIKKKQKDEVNKILNRTLICSSVTYIFLGVLFIIIFCNEDLFCMKFKGCYDLAKKEAYKFYSYKLGYILSFLYIFFGFESLFVWIYSIYNQNKNERSNIRSYLLASCMNI